MFTISAHQAPSLHEEYYTFGKGGWGKGNRLWQSVGQGEGKALAEPQFLGNVLTGSVGAVRFVPHGGCEFHKAHPAPVVATSGAY